MSRLCVKNLPKYVSEDRLREFFSQKGEVTDAKLMRTKDGKSRQFGFVGFRSENEALVALKYFNNSYLDTCRINCEVARKVGDPDIPRPWSRHSLKKVEDLNEVKRAKDAKDLGLASDTDHKKKKKKNKNSDSNDSQLQEFLQVMQPRTKSQLWSNDALTDAAVNTNNVVLPVRKKIASLLESDETETNENDSLDTKRDNKLTNLDHDVVMSDMDYLKSRTKKEWSDSLSGDAEVDDENDAGHCKDDGNINKSLKKSYEGQGPQKVSGMGVDDLDVNNNASRMIMEDKHADDEMLDASEPSTGKDDMKEGLESCRLFVRNLPYTATEEELEEQFGKFGSISQVHVVVDKDTKRSKGFAYVFYTDAKSAARALEQLDNSVFQGRLLHVMPAKEKLLPQKQEFGILVNGSSKSFKQKREDERKASEANGNTQAWNSLFMRPDTVVENIARKFGVSKSDLLDREADDLAVRIALGETQVLADTKRGLANAGINITALEGLANGKNDGVKRSNHVILVKNLPYGSSEGELAKMFEKYGNLDKIVLPSTKTLALVIFLEPAEARAAFKGLAYKRYKDAPLYLEWAPGNILDANTASVIDANTVIVGEKEAKKAFLEQQVEGIVDDDADPDRIESRSVFVKNLNFKTTDESLKKYFDEKLKEGKILSVSVKKHVKNGKNVSMGFGFIELDSVDTAANVCRDLQGTVFDGHALILQLCHGKKGEKAKKTVDKDRSSTKLIVRNVAFEATEKDLRQLFSPFGQVKSLRLPMRFGNHRGFGFVEFLTKQETQNALEALSNTHLYGRHLVLERAKEGESLEELRARTAAQFNDDNSSSVTKLSKKRKHSDEFDEM
ncbi:multiple RNA-binding domain-containing protein 1 [Impatiens glandulifera]|uniref:multiple RNA-binding domain-containing protein 1 n=1 Tax=Impatiens glandulifera TaxID=253017 RepID=UPI001FB0ADA0|nr:multiple RNA-binding domain-containing protein 1 [Impatiens glandulifera]